MNFQNNVVNMPDPLAARAVRAVRAYEAGMAKHRAGLNEAVAAVIEYGHALAEKRGEYKSDPMFGQWVKDNGLDLTKPFDLQQERSAAIKIAEMSTQRNFPLGNCPRSRPTDIMSWWRNAQRAKNVKIGERLPPKARKVPEAAEYVKAHKAETGAYPSEKDMTAAGFSDGTASKAKVIVQTEEALAEQELIQAKFTKAQDHHVAMRLKVLVKQQEKLFEAKVLADVKAKTEAMREELYRQQKTASEKQALYDAAMNKFQPVFTEAEFMVILKCLHPDNSASEETRAHAFNTFKMMKLQLTGKR